MYRSIKMAKLKSLAFFLIIIGTSAAQNRTNVTSSPKGVTSPPKVFNNTSNVVAKGPEVVNNASNVVTNGPEVVFNSPNVTNTPEVVTKAPKPVNKAPRVVTESGKITGFYMKSYKGKKYEAYEGIPYAEKPISELRL